MKGLGLLLLVPSALSAIACGYDNGDIQNPPERPPVTPVEVPIDLNGFFDTAQLGEGQGAAVRVEYGPAGHWRVFTTCDTNRSGYACTWDIFLTVPDDSRVTALQMESFEEDDWVYWHGPTKGEFSPVTSSDIDGISFDAEPGQPLRIEAYLDDPEYTQGANAFIYWISDGAGNKGAPTNPVDLIPPAP